jgi:putative SOS response-associated peptidase YedK
MCGRYALTATLEQIRALFGFLEAEPFPPRYNIAPTQPIGVIHRVRGQRRFTLMRWGLIPAWVEDPRQFALLINARSESAAEKPAFANALRYRRCLIPATGFYEWRRQGRTRQPFWISPRDRRVVAFAGLYETWSDRDGGEIDTACILTMDANATLAPIHNRMPVIIAPPDFDRWLASTGEPGDDISCLLKPPGDGLLEAIPVGESINKADSEGPSLQARVEPKDDPAPLLPGLL